MLHTIWNEGLIKPIFNTLVFLYNLIPGHDLGLAIIALTIIISLILYWPNLSAIRAQREMQKLQPKLKKIQEKYKDDKQKQSEKTMGLYKEHKINPLGSCLPLIIQLPILFALFRVFRFTLVDENSFSMLYSFIKAPDSLNVLMFNILDLTKPDRFVLPIFAGVLQLWQSIMIQKRTNKDKEQNPSPDKKDENKGAFDPSMLTKQMTYIFPIVTVVISMSLPAAVTLYWATRNLFAVGQQYIVMKDENDEGIVKKKRGVRVRIRDKS